MLLLKIVLPLAALGAAIVQVLLSDKWHDKGTGAHRRTRSALYGLMILATLGTIVLSMNDYVSSEKRDAVLIELRDQQEHVRQGRTIHGVTSARSWATGAWR